MNLDGKKIFSSEPKHKVGDWYRTKTFPYLEDSIIERTSSLDLLLQVILF